MEIVITGSSMSLEEGHRALKAPSSELRNLTEEEKAVAKGFGITEEQYARMELAGRYGDERLNKAAHVTADTIERELVKLAPDAKPKTLIYAVGLDPHRVLVTYKGKDYTFKFSSDDESDLRAFAKKIAESLA